MHNRDLILTELLRTYDKEANLQRRLRLFVPHRGFSSSVLIIETPTPTSLQPVLFPPPCNWHGKAIEFST